MRCIDTNNKEFQTLVKRSGLSEYVVKAFCSTYKENVSEENWKWPKLDELPYSNSEPALLELLQVRKDGSAKTKTILDLMNASSPQEATVKINLEFTDLETEIVPLLEEDSLVKVTKRPNLFSQDTVELDGYSDLEINSLVAFNQIFERLESLYGIKVIPVTTQELLAKEFESLGARILQAKAFIYNGQIFVNTDKASVDSPIHELLHVLLGGLKQTNPRFYVQLVGSIQGIQEFNVIALEYKGRTRGDILEEVFVNLLSKYLTGQPSGITSLNSDQQYELFYNIGRMLDSMLMGEISARSLDETELCSMSLMDIADRVNSHAFENTFKGCLDRAAANRIASNIKEDLMSKNELEENCV